MKIVSNRVNGEVHGIRIERSFVEKFLKKYPYFIDGLKICAGCFVLGTIGGIILCII